MLGDRPVKDNIFLIALPIIAGLSIALVKSCADVKTIKYDNDVLRNDNILQGQVIATQTFNFNRFNQAAAETGRLNSLIGAHTEKTVIEYREILRRDKTCDLPVPDDVANGLLEYATRLRLRAMHPDTRGFNSPDIGAATTRKLTYCEVVLWVNPLLSAIDKANNQIIGISTIEKERK